MYNDSDCNNELLLLDAYANNLINPHLYTQARRFVSEMYKFNEDNNTCNTILSKGEIIYKKHVDDRTVVVVNNISLTKNKKMIDNFNSYILQNKYFPIADLKNIEIILEKGFYHIINNMNVTYKFYLCKYDKTKLDKEDTYSKKIREIINNYNTPHLVSYFGMSKFNCNLDKINNIIKIEKFKSSECDKGSDIYILCHEQAKGVPLYEYIGSKNITKEKLEMILFQIYYTLHVLAKKQISHVDLHCGNIFVEELQVPSNCIYAYDNKIIKTSTSIMIKIIDYGESTTIEDYKENIENNMERFKESLLEFIDKNNKKINLNINGVHDDKFNFYTYIDYATKNMNRKTECCKIINNLDEINWHELNGIYVDDDKKMLDISGNITHRIKNINDKIYINRIIKTEIGAKDVIDYYENIINKIIRDKLNEGKTLDEFKTNSKIRNEFKVLRSNSVTDVITKKVVAHEEYNIYPSNKETNSVLTRIYKNHIKTDFDEILKICGGATPNGNIPCMNYLEKMINDIQYKLPKPSSVQKMLDKIIMEFKFNDKNKLYCNTIEDTNIINLTLEEQKNITKDKYAYVTLFFPGYRRVNGTYEKSYSYVIGTLMVAYMLKNFPQNFDLYENGSTGTKASVLCMITPDVDENIIEILKIYYDDVVIVPYIAWDNVLLPDEIKNDPKKMIKISDVSKGNIAVEHAYNKVFTKINMFNKELFDYEKVMILDTDLFPFGYFDSLFSLDTPAGWLEHKRYKYEENGVHEWQNSRCGFTKHGHRIPKEFTDIYNVYGADVNASLYVVSPDNATYDEMMKELQMPMENWFGTDKQHKGFWIANMFFSLYYLPEQNYLTQKFSGKWTSIDLGFCTWLLDLQSCFGFTFAGFQIKPWGIQSLYHRYSINPYAEFSKSNNKMTNKSLGFSMLNNLICKMIFDLDKKYQDSLVSQKPIVSTKEFINDYIIRYGLDVLDTFFDPWDQEINVGNLNKYSLGNRLDIEVIKKMSYDQKKLYYTIQRFVNTDDTHNMLYKLLFYDYNFDNFFRNMTPLYYSLISLSLVDTFLSIISTNIRVNTAYIIPHGKTMYGSLLYDTLYPTSDDISFMLVHNYDVDKFNYTVQLISTLLNYNIFVYVTFTDNTIVQIMLPDQEPSYVVYARESIISLDKLLNKINNIKMIKILYPQPLAEFILAKEKLTTDSSLFNKVMVYGKENVIPKFPWINIFIGSQKHDRKFIGFTKDREYIFNGDKLKKKLVIDKHNVDIVGLGDIDKFYNYSHYSSHGEYPKFYDITEIPNSGSYITVYDRSAENYNDILFQVTDTDIIELLKKCITEYNLKTNAKYKEMQNYILSIIVRSKQKLITAIEQRRNPIQNAGGQKIKKYKLKYVNKQNN